MPRRSLRPQGAPAGMAPHLLCTRKQDLEEEGAICTFTDLHQLNPPPPPTPSRNSAGEPGWQEIWSQPTLRLVAHSRHLLCDLISTSLEIRSPAYRIVRMLEITWGNLCRVLWTVLGTEKALIYRELPPSSSLSFRALKIRYSFEGHGRSTVPPRSKVYREASQMLPKLCQYSRNVITSHLVGSIGSEVQHLRFKSQPYC